MNMNMNATYDVQRNRLAIPHGVVYRYQTAPNDGKAEPLIEPVCVGGQQPDIMAVSIALETLASAFWRGGEMRRETTDLFEHVLNKRRCVPTTLRIRVGTECLDFVHVPNFIPKRLDH